MSVPLLTASGVEKRYEDARNCGECAERAGPEAGTNQCPVCGTVVACADIDLAVHEGEVLGIVGESGSGKSSLAEILALDADATAGDARFAPHEGNMLETDYQERFALRNAHIGMVHQHIRDGLELGISGGGNVAEKLLANGWRSYDAIRDRVRELYGETEIPVGRMDDETTAYSGGMQQIGRAHV